MCFILKIRRSANKWKLPERRIWISFPDGAGGRYVF